MKKKQIERAQTLEGSKIVEFLTELEKILKRKVKLQEAILFSARLEDVGEQTEAEINGIRMKRRNQDSYIR